MVSIACNAAIFRPDWEEIFGNNKPAGTMGSIVHAGLESGSLSLLGWKTGYRVRHVVVSIGIMKLFVL